MKFHAAATGVGLLALLALGSVPHAAAGTADAPEITDAAGDHVLSPAGIEVASLGPVCTAPGAPPCFNRIDILAAWIDMETATAFNVNILLANAPLSAVQYDSNYEFHATFGGTEVVSSVTTTDAGPVAGENVAAVAADGNTLIVTIDKSIYGATAGELTAIFIAGQATLVLAGVELANDRAPDADGVTYTMGGTAGNATDTDNDGLNDTCEIKYFGNITVTNNATADPDGDGVSNVDECKNGTDPTKADTDGDGVSDKDDCAPLDATKSCATSSSSSSRSTSSSSRSTSSSATSTGEEPCDGAVDCLQANVGYLGASSVGMLAVVILSLLALLVRWSL